MFLIAGGSWMRESGFLGYGFGWSRANQAAHSLHQLRVHFARDDHDAQKQRIRIEFALMEMQGPECGNLDYPRFFNEHGGRVALPVPHRSVLGSGFRNRPRNILFTSQAADQVTEQLRQMTGAIPIAQGT
jgi:hypothetical protein